jgi:hypothetical protein
MLNIRDRLKKYDPFAVDDEGGESVLTLDSGAKIILSKKIRHAYADGQRVLVHSPGHVFHGKPGVLVDCRNDNRMRVKMDTGHEIEAGPDDLCPEDLGPVASSSKILKAAIDSGVVSAHDQAQIQICLEKVRTGVYATSPFAETLCDSPVRNLEIYAEKYQASDTSNVLSKRAKTDFERSLKVGDQVRDHLARVAKITEIKERSVTLDFGNGVTGISLFGYLQAA